MLSNVNVVRRKSLIIVKVIKCKAFVKIKKVFAIAVKVKLSEHNKAKNIFN